LAVTSEPLRPEERVAEVEEQDRRDDEPGDVAGAHQSTFPISQIEAAKSANAASAMAMAARSPTTGDATPGQIKGVSRVPANGIKIASRR
jgi:hypothetical protein